MRQPSRALLAAARAAAYALLLLLSLAATWRSYTSESAKSSFWWACVPLDESHFDARFFDPSACISTRERAQKLEALVRALATLLTRHDVDFWLDSGTLLGQFRSQRVIRWDTDADVGITESGYRFLRDNVVALEPVEEEGEETATAERPKLYELQVYESQVNVGPDRDWNVPIRLVETSRGFYVDVFVFAESSANGVEMLGTAPSASWAKCAKCVQVGAHAKLFLIPKSYVFPLLPCAFGGSEALCPAKRTLYLEHLYGADFREENPSF